MPAAKSGRSNTEDLLAAFRRKIDRRIDKGERQEVHAASAKEEKRSPESEGSASEEEGRQSPEEAPPKPAKRPAPARLSPPRSRMRGFDDSNSRKQSLLGDESRKQSLLDGPLEEEEAPPKPAKRPPARLSPPQDRMRSCDEGRKQSLLDGPLEPEAPPPRRGRRDVENFLRRDVDDRFSDRRREPEERREKRQSAAENKERLGRGGRLTEKRAPKEVQKAKGRDMASHGTFSRPRTVKVSNIPEGLEWRYIKELFESAAGKVIEGQFEEDDGVAWLTFEKPDAASTAHFDFDGGELADQVIKVELIDED
eukprot:s1459_g4.t2